MKSKKSRFAVMSLFLIMVFCFMTISVCAEGTNENLCRFFDGNVGVAVGRYFGTDAESMDSYDKMPVGYLFYCYTITVLRNQGKLDQYTKTEQHEVLGSVETYTIPYDDFVQCVSSYTDITYDFTKENEFYRPETNDFYFVSNGIIEDGVDLGHPAYVIGYTPHTNNRYTVFVQRMQYGFDSIQALEAELQPGGEFYDNIEGKPYYEDYSREKDVFLDYYGEYHLVHRNYIYKVDITYENGNIVYHSIICKDEKDDEMPLITPSTVVSSGKGCSLIAGKEAFPTDTIIGIKSIENGDEFTKIKGILSDKAKSFVLYDITATLNNQTVQPNEKVKVTFDIPKEYNSKQVVIFYVSPDGKVENMNGKIDEQAGTISAELDHFSIYAVAELNEKSNVPDTGDANQYISYVLLCIAAVVGITVTISQRKKHFT